MKDNEDARKVEGDAECKRVLSSRLILSHLLHLTVPEFFERDVNWIYQNAFLGELEMPDVVNPETRIVGANTESSSETEGVRRFDLLFPAQYGESPEERVWVNIEQQGEFPAGEGAYPPVYRAHYYLARILSNEYQTEFRGMEYQNLKKVYSIWIFTSPPKDKENGLTYFSTEQHAMGMPFEQQVEQYELLEPVMICLGNAAKDSFIPAVDFCHTLFGKLSDRERIEKLETKYQCKLDNTEQEDIRSMSSIMDAVYKDGKTTQHTEDLTIVNMIRQNKTNQEILQAVQCEESQIEAFRTALAS